MMSLIDRPSVAFSACTVPQKTLFIESGYNYQKIIPTGNAHFLPQTELRLGMPHNTEIDIFPPNFTQQYTPNQSGFSASSIGLKHVGYFDAHQLVTFQGYITPPSGSQSYGTRNTSFLINGIYSYNFDSGLGFSGSLGFASNSDIPSSDNNNYYSFNPIIDIGWSFSEHLSSYIEFYSQSKTAIDQGWGVSFDGGLILLAANNITLDVSAGQRISGVLGNIEHYVGAGFVIALS